MVPDHFGMMSEKKLSIFRFVYSKVASYGRGEWLWKDYSGTCDVRCRGESIYTHIHTLIWCLGFGIAWGFDYDIKGNHYIQQEHVVKWDHCEYHCLASRVWWGHMELFT